MIERTQERFGLWPERLAADTAYGSAENLAWLVHERGIEPHIPVIDKSAAAGRHVRAQPTSPSTTRPTPTPAPPASALRAWPPEDLPSVPRTGASKNGMVRYSRQPVRTATPCALKPRCCPKASPARKILHDPMHEGARDMARDLATTEAYWEPHAASGRRSRCCSLTSNGSCRLDRLRLRGPNGARDEFLLAATAQNLRRLAKLVTPVAPLPAT